MTKTIRQKLKRLWIDTQEGGAIHLRDDEIDKIIDLIKTEVIGEDEGTRELTEVDEAFGVTKVVITTYSGYARNQLREEQRAKL